MRRAWAAVAVVVVMMLRWLTMVVMLRWLGRVAVVVWRGASLVVVVVLLVVVGGGVGLGLVAVGGAGRRRAPLPHHGSGRWVRGRLLRVLVVVRSVLLVVLVVVAGLLCAVRRAVPRVARTRMLVRLMRVGLMHAVAVPRLWWRVMVSIVCAAVRSNGAVVVVAVCALVRSVAVGRWHVL